MKFQVHLPGERLLPYVKHLVISENEQENANTVLPDTALVIGFQYRGKLSYWVNDEQRALDPAGITGLNDT